MTASAEMTLFTLTREHPDFQAEAIGENVVLAMMNRLEPYGTWVPNYAEIAAVIAQAANHDPLLPGRKDGCKLTAALLVALAFVRSGFHPNLTTQKGFGLFQIRPPSPRIDGNRLLRPRDAAYIAVDLVRQSMLASREEPWEVRLAWLLSETGAPSTADVKKSMDIMILAESVFEGAFGSRPKALPEGR